MPKTRRLLTNFSKGELSPKLEGRPDLAAYFEGASAIENFVLMRQGGLNRRVGTRFIAEVKNPERDTVLLPFEVAVNKAYVIEAGDQYMRFYKDKTRIEDPPGVPVEIESPYFAEWLRYLHFTQSVDVLFLFATGFHQRTLSHVDDVTWVLSPIVYSPPPSFEADTDISQGPVDSSALISVIYPVEGNVGGIFNVIAGVRPGVSVKSIQFQRNAIDFGPLITAIPYSFEWNTTIDPDFTTYTLTAILTDVQDIQSVSLGVIVVVDNTTPPPPGGGGEIPGGDPSGGGGDPSGGGDGSGSGDGGGVGDGGAE